MSNFVVSEIKISLDAIHFAVLDWSRVSSTGHNYFVMTSWSESWNVPGQGIVYGSVVSVVLLEVIVIKRWVIPIDVNVSVQYFNRISYYALKVHCCISSFLYGWRSYMWGSIIELESTYIIRTLCESWNSGVVYWRLDAFNEALYQVLSEKVLRSKQVNLYLIGCWSKVCS
jgi:hypothetical protein